jgi:hypothetical protein
MVIHKVYNRNHTLFRPPVYCGDYVIYRAYYVILGVFGRFSVDSEHLAANFLRFY